LTKDWLDHQLISLIIVDHGVIDAFAFTSAFNITFAERASFHDHGISLWPEMNVKREKRKF